MAILENRVKTNNLFLDLTRSAAHYVARFLTIFFIALSVVLINLPENSSAKRLVIEISSTILSPINLIYDSVINSASQAQQYVSEISRARSENIALKLENTKLRKILEETSQINSENAQLRRQLKFQSKKKYKVALSSRLISNFSGLYAKGGIMSAGTTAGIKANQVVISDGYIIGKIATSYNNHAHVMFINDIRSRIPIITSISGEKAILTGDGHKGGKLLYVPQEHKIKIGEQILSSGDGKYYPYGIPIAKVTKVDNINVYVEPLANLSKLQFVSVLGS